MMSGPPQADAATPKNDGWMNSSAVQRGDDVKIHNVMSSVSAAGSGDFHTYRSQRRAEQDRLTHMDKSDKDRVESDAFEERQAIRHAEDEARHAKNVEKRNKKKQKAKHAKIRQKWEKTLKSSDTTPSTTEGGNSSGEAEQDKDHTEEADTKEKGKGKDHTEEADRTTKRQKPSAES
eukprot:TRINITY_DN3042_c0_g1_i3.p1 TRINITY_DN3042_c0_g1~~TRINITY_DN3042_c0_g1_i3.p1  ORF type:complete len:177 (-),score=46.74 TRINITY_DN3042_c0_g1_i3:21-551(-)